jgi:hypothetical protein
MSVTSQRAKRRTPQAIPPTICGKCYELIDLAPVHDAIRKDETYTHDCGRVLYRSKGEA